MCSSSQADAFPTFSGAYSAYVLQSYKIFSNAATLGAFFLEKHALTGSNSAPLTDLKRTWNEPDPFSALKISLFRLSASGQLRVSFGNPSLNAPVT